MRVCRSIADARVHGGSALSYCLSSHNNGHTRLYKLNPERNHGRCLLLSLNRVNKLVETAEKSERNRIFDLYLLSSHEISNLTPMMALAVADAVQLVYTSRRLTNNIIHLSLLIVFFRPSLAIFAVAKKNSIRISPGVGTYPSRSEMTRSPAYPSG